MFHKRRNNLIFALFLFTGVRLQEFRELKMVDVNLNEGVLTVRQGKGGKDRVIPIAFELKNHINLYLQERDKLGILLLI